MNLRSLFSAYRPVLPQHEPAGAGIELADRRPASSALDRLATPNRLSTVQAIAAILVRRASSSPLRALLAVAGTLALTWLLWMLLFGHSTVKHYWLTLTYLARPLWDKPATPFTVLPHYYAPHVPWPLLCERHQWRPLAESDRVPKVFDAILFSVEIELLEIRIRELMDVVDMFLILESNSTFTGIAKPFVFEANAARFAFAAHKIKYTKASMRPLDPGEDPFHLESEHRQQMNALIASSGIEPNDWLLTMDVDEIPSWHTVRLLQSCSGIPSPLHLQLRNYLYSFEFMVDMDSWRGKAVRYPAYYGHARAGDLMLADAGWHCSFCFRRLADFVFKMSAYSHADRVHSAAVLDPQRIQAVVCEGRDIYDMVPEAFTYKDMMKKWGAIERQASAVGLPAYLIEHATEFAFLLPGGCKREP
ncbi:glycosyltransferase family 17-domain-containing protein [Entophlyctis helioformis]|nr:glycosyltransferase family 17-domain-containing protein [Entophlyctis helioformis]